MALNYRGSGDNIDFNGVIETGTTITAGVMVWSTGTAAIVAPLSAVVVTGLLESANFLGVMANTQTGVSRGSGGSQTGVTISRKGVYEFTTLAAGTAAAVLVGQEVWAAGPSTVQGFGVTATERTGIPPVGICVWLNEPDTSAASVRCHVDIWPGHFLGEVPAQTGGGLI